MIVVNKAIVRPILTSNNTFDLDGKNKILQSLYESQEVFIYDNKNQLEFDIAIRYYLVTSSPKLFYGGIQFRDFYSSYCNPYYWYRTPVGGFKLLPHQKASDAITDIFMNGHLYGTECATAIMILIYFALLNVMQEEQFNKLFQNIHLYTWNYENIIKIKTVFQKNFVQGDIVYFKNPQVHPLTPQWQGENTIYLGDNSFYGHGAGIATAEHIIMKLNENRIPGATKSAYLTDHITRLDSKQMSYLGDYQKTATNVSFNVLHDRDFTLIQIGNFAEVDF